MTISYASRGGSVVQLSVALAVAALVVPASAAHAWPVAPAVEPPCEPGQGCSEAATPAAARETAAASAATSSPAAGAPPAAEGATIVSPVPPSPATTTTVAPIADGEEPRTARPQPSPSPAVTPGTPPPAVVPGGVFMFDVGLHTLVGKGSDNFYPGLRTGMLLGGRLGSQLSGNAELVIDLLNPDTPNGVSVTEVFFDLTFSPLLHVPTSPTTQFILGPRLGLFSFVESASVQMESVTVWGWGWAWGVNAGFLATQSTRRLGFLASFNARTPEKVCADSDSTPERCTSEGLRTAKMLSLAFLVML